MSSLPHLDTFSDIFYSSSDTSRPSSPLSPPPTTSHPLSPPPSPPSTTFPPSSPPSTTLPPHSPPSTFTHLINNPDINRLHTTHHTAGYRDGISSSKTSFLQRGFDEGYALGAELGVRVGYILGILEGLRGGCGSTTAPAASKTTSSPPTADVAVGEKEDWSKMKKILDEARRELVVERVFAREWWGEDGVWRFEVGEEGEREAGGEEGVTFAKVAEEHPLLKSWLKRVRAEMRRLGVREGRFEGEEWEKGRVGGEMA